MRTAVDHPHIRPRRILLARLVAGAAALPLVLAGCSAGSAPPTPTPATTTAGSTETSTPLPRVPGAADPREIDPRCLAQFPDRAEIIDEAQVPGRPDFWPPAPEWAVLCFTELENDFTQVGWYATDPGISRAEIYRTYEHAIIGIGQTARATIPEGEIVTGVVLPDHSFWIIAGRDHFRVTWSQDGEYAG